MAGPISNRKERGFGVSPWVSPALSHFAAFWSSFHPDHHDGQVGGGNAGDARGLAESGGANLGQLHFGFGAQAGDLGVVQPIGDALVFEGFEPLDFEFLAVDVSRWGQTEN